MRKILIKIIILAIIINVEGAKHVMNVTSRDDDEFSK